MLDKRTTFDAAVASIESGMTIGIGGWGSRRKPMGFVRALLRTGVTDLTVVSYGGPDVGLFVFGRQGQTRLLRFRVPGLTAVLRSVVRQGAYHRIHRGAGNGRGNVCAAAFRLPRKRLPFLPIRAGLGSDVRTFWGDELKTVTSPYPTGADYEELVAMPALNLDVSFVHLNVGDAQGNAAYTGIDPYFDDVYLMAAQKRFLSVERVVSTEELVASVPPQALLVNRMMVDGVVEAPGGAHFTTAAPDYERDEGFQRHYATAASSEETWQEFVETYLSGDEADYQAAVRTFEEARA